VGKENKTAWVLQKKIVCGCILDEYGYPAPKTLTINESKCIPQ